MRSQRQPLRQHGDTTPALGLRRGVRIDFARRHDCHRSRRSVVRGRAAGDARRFEARSHQQLAGDLTDLCGRDGPRSQQAHARVLERDDRGLEADLTLAAVENHFHRLAKLLAHVLGACRRQFPITIGGGGGDAAAEGGEQLLRHGMRRHADRDRVLATGYDIVHVRRPWHHHRERTRPEALGETQRQLRHLTHPTVQITLTVEVDDHRMGRRPALGLENPAHGGRVLRIRSEPVYGLRGKSDQLAIAQRLHSGLDLDLGSPDDANHGG